jgi:hypothetical protein
MSAACRFNNVAMGGGSVRRIKDGSNSASRWTIPLGASGVRIRWESLPGHQIAN